MIVLQGKLGFLFLCLKQSCAYRHRIFFNMIVQHYGFTVDELTPSTVNKIVCFELISRTLGRVPTFWVYSYFFCLTTNSSVRILAKRRGIHQLISELDTLKKNWKRQWLLVNQNLIGHGYCRKLDFFDHLPKLFRGNLALGKWMRSVTIRGENWEDFYSCRDRYECRLEGSQEDDAYVRREMRY